MNPYPNSSYLDSVYFTCRRQRLRYFQTIGQLRACRYNRLKQNLSESNPNSALILPDLSDVLDSLLLAGNMREYRDILLKVLTLHDLNILNALFFHSDFYLEHAKRSSPLDPNIALFIDTILMNPIYKQNRVIHMTNLIVPYLKEYLGPSHNVRYERIEKIRQTENPTLLAAVRKLIPHHPMYVACASYSVSSKQTSEGKSLLMKRLLGPSKDDHSACSELEDGGVKNSQKESLNAGENSRLDRELLAEAKKRIPDLSPLLSPRISSLGVRFVPYSIPSRLNASEGNPFSLQRLLGPSKNDHSACSELEGGGSSLKNSQSI